jgi:hypothetical protein
MLVRLRIWLPDAPGILGAVAAEIGAADGNVIGLEVLERAPGVAIDELVVELPDQPGAIDAVCKGIHTIAGAGVEDARPVSSPGPDREGTVLGAAVAILQAATPNASLNALLGQLRTHFELTWIALADLEREDFVEVHGDVPSVQWVVAFVEGSRSGPDPANATIGSGVFAEPIAETRFHVCGGRSAALRRRERHEIALLAVVTARFIDALGGRELSP